MKLKFFYLLLLLGIMQGSAFLFMKLAGQSFSTASIVFFRLFFAAIVIVPYVLYSTHSYHIVWKAHKKIFITLAFTSTVIPFSLIAWAVQYIASGIEAVYMALIPLFVAIFEYFGKEKIRFSKEVYLGFVFGFLGILLLSFQDILKYGGENAKGHFAVFLSAIFYGYSVYKTRQLGNVGPAVTNAYVLSISALISLPFMLLTQDWNVNFSLQAVGAMISLALVSTAGALLLMYYLIHQVGSVFTATTNYLVPIIGLLLGALFLDETITFFMLPALLLVLLGVFFIRKSTVSFNK
ncbi:DMT family transporter [Acinetobacter sp. TUM15071]|uniref:DMT family transporter n=1 Tax=Acinetobacter TaxID=469 RepID=UPI00124C829C|nr:DMT family transporter [Acinetobacter sp. TUM15071]